MCWSHRLEAKTEEHLKEESEWNDVEGKEESCLGSSETEVARISPLAINLSQMEGHGGCPTKLSLGSTNEPTFGNHLETIIDIHGLSEIVRNLSAICNTLPPHVLTRRPHRRTHCAILMGPAGDISVCNALRLASLVPRSVPACLFRIQQATHRLYWELHPAHVKHTMHGIIALRSPHTAIKLVHPVIIPCGHCRWAVHSQIFLFACEHQLFRVARPHR
ncbi:hypothetical protein C8R45DRAFT_1070263 [Mycena sanguinolenta]|nr:hypothetical protein C8R45DRAFT_1070263 [Mycena sanguinolenta]